MVTYQTITADVDSTAANRAGRHTPEQQRGLANMVRSENMNSLVVAGLLAFLLLPFLLAGSQGEPIDMGPPAYWMLGGLLVVSLMGIVFFIGRRARMLAEVQAGRLERTRGHVQRKSGRYRAAAPGRSQDLRGFDLAVGTYKFSLLLRSGRVMTAELAAAGNPAQAEDQQRMALAVSNYFNLDDLPYFRRGPQGPGIWLRLRRTD